MGSSLALTRFETGKVSEELWEEAAALPCRLSVELPLRRFTVSTLLQLEKGSILESGNGQGADVPLLVNAHLLGWAEFEVLGQRLAVRVTELA